MVSGFVTSPCDQLRIFSGEARLMRIASKSAIGFARSNGLERNKISSTPAATSLPPAAPIMTTLGCPVQALLGREYSVAGNFAGNAGAWRYQLFSSNFL